MNIHPLLNAYQSKIQQENWIADPAQLAIIKQFSHLGDALVRQNHWKQRWLRRFKRLLGLPITPVTGLYLWGDVGRGKTFLLDLFYHELPIEQKGRLHFHRFMQEVHHALTFYQGVSNPIAHVARDFSEQLHVLCFDELYVSDIADAMILGELFRHLLGNGVTLVITSNIEPQGLYPNGLQRAKFLPAIALLCKYTHVQQLLGAQDFRLRYLSKGTLYHYPITEQTDKNLLKTFQQLAPEAGVQNQILTIMDRQVPTLWCAQSVAWFSFETLCLTARSFQDYIEIARDFHTVIISGVKMMDEQQEDAAKRFIALIDEFYERHVVCIISAEAPMDKLYQGKRYQFEFQRTLSRLTQMQSQEYLSQPHLA